MEKWIFLHLPSREKRSLFRFQTNQRPGRAESHFSRSFHSIWEHAHKKMESILLSIAFYFPDFALRRASALERAACV